MKCVIVYTSVTGNTKELAENLYQSFLSKEVDIQIYRIEQFSTTYLNEYDAIVIGTYTWGNGQVPQEMRRLYRAFEMFEKKDKITAVFGTGDSFYPHYCGAVDQFRDMLYVHSNLAATLKVELFPQQQDEKRCQKFVQSIFERAQKLV
ncbi:flavodoxin domain-containing protein [Mesobacillus maritimus]|uniref:flavodoxin domain-containing protein n=1 Tax=Mesobacillus maritimus TaxID=1643336 RepID=UPI00203EF3FC|nr:flavodoxin domain-containing protein [Mesobacillus maritimus]MCM3668621.1 flavodoxin domain-containing protein [Mesobacillus maritimus]